MLSTTEGDDKPRKYPKAFRTSQVVVISKTDLLPHVPFSLDAAKEDALAVQSTWRYFRLVPHVAKGWTRGATSSA